MDICNRLKNPQLFENSLTNRVEFYFLNCLCLGKNKFLLQNSHNYLKIAKMIFRKKCWSNGWMYVFIKIAISELSK